MTGLTGTRLYVSYWFVVPVCALFIRMNLVTPCLATERHCHKRWCPFLKSSRRFRSASWEFLVHEGVLCEWLSCVVTPPVSWVGVRAFCRHWQVRRPSVAETRDLADLSRTDLDCGTPRFFGSAMKRNDLVSKSVSKSISKAQISKEWSVNPKQKRFYVLFKLVVATVLSYVRL